MNGDAPAYGLWFLAALNAGLFILFAFSFFKPTTARDWRSLGAFSAFVASNLPYQPGVRKMKTRNIHTALFAGLLLLGTATSVAAQTAAPEQDPHHPAETQAASPSPATPGDAPAAAASADAMPGMGMMTPEMMQMMQRMMGQGGMPGMMGQGVTEGGAGPGMMGQVPMAGMMMCPMMRVMMGGQAGMGMPGMMGNQHGMMGNQGGLFGAPLGAAEEMTEDRVRALLERQLDTLGNPRLKLGGIGTASDGSITAEIVTVDGSLVQKLAFNRYPGLVRPIVE